MSRRSGTTTLGDIAVHKSWDSSSPVLWARVGSGKNQDPVTIELCSDMGGNTVCNLQLVLSNCISSSYSLSATGDMSPTPSELITLNYEKLSWTYTPYKADGTAGGAVTASVDTASGATLGRLSGSPGGAVRPAGRVWVLLAKADLSGLALRRARPLRSYMHAGGDMAGLTQDLKRMQVTTPLGKDKLLLTNFQGTEEFSRPFHFGLTMVSEDSAIDPKKIVGQERHGHAEIPQR